MTVSKEDILEEVATYMHGYLKEGKHSIQPFLRDIDVHIHSIIDLLKIRFLFLENTIQFVELLPNRLKRFKTTTIAHKELTHSDIRGRILWQETLQERFKAGNDQTIYVTSEQNRSYDTDENLVLKETLTILHQLLSRDNILHKFEKTKWAQSWKQLSPHIEMALHKNSYIERVSSVQTTRKQRLRAAQHRMPIYREAAELLKQYYRLIRGEYTQEELKDVLNATFILADNEDVLMELYWTIQLIKERTDQETYFLMPEGESKVAEWKDDGYKYIVSHNSSGSKDLKFLISFDELLGIDHPVIAQMIVAKEWADYHASRAFGGSYKRGLWNGRPDILIEKRQVDNGDLVEVIIGEVKNTDYEGYAKEGLWELSEYLHYLRNNQNEYLNNQIVIRGILCLGDLTVVERNIGYLEIKTLSEK